MTAYDSFDKIDDIMDTSKWYNKKILCIPIWAISAAVLIAAAASAQQQTLQLATYYPAPYGDYNEMRVAEKLEILDELEAEDAFKIDLKNDSDKFKCRVYASTIYDLEDSRYKIEPTGITQLNKLEAGDLVYRPSNLVSMNVEGNGEIMFGKMVFKNWPVVATPGYTQDASATATSIPLAQYVPEGNSTMRIFCGTYKGPSQTAKVKLPSIPDPANPGSVVPVFKDTNYFVAISPRDLKTEPFNVEKHSHWIENTNQTTGDNQPNIVLNFKNYSISEIKKSGDQFEVSFEDGTDAPDEFDWIVIGQSGPALAAPTP